MATCRCAACNQSKIESARRHDDNPTSRYGTNQRSDKINSAPSLVAHMRRGLPARCRGDLCYDIVEERRQYISEIIAFSIAWRRNVSRRCCIINGWYAMILRILLSAAYQYRSVSAKIRRRAVALHVARLMSRNICWHGGIAALRRAKHVWRRNNCKGVGRN